MFQLSKNPFPLSFTLGMTFLGFAIAQLSYFIISISLDSELWWNVIQTINISSINLVLAYIMFIVGLTIMATGFLLTATRDRNI